MFVCFFHEINHTFGSQETRLATMALIPVKSPAGPQIHTKAPMQLQRPWHVVIKKYQRLILKPLNLQQHWHILTHIGTSSSTSDLVYHLNSTIPFAFKDNHFHHAAALAKIAQCIKAPKQINHIFHAWAVASEEGCWSVSFLGVSGR